MRAIPGNFILCCWGLVALLLGSAGALPTMAQTSKGIISGVVRDPAGAVIAAASVTVTAEDSGERRTTSTTSVGAFRIDAVNPGHYMLHIEAQGFRAAEVRDLNVLPSIVTSYNPVLIVGEVSQIVTVEANTNLINTENGGLSGTLSSEEMAKVPIFSLDPIELAATVPGVQILDPGLNLGVNAGNGIQLEVNGARGRANNFMIDGQEINDVSLLGQAFQPQIPDAFQTVTVLTSVAPAEYGRASGGIFNLVTKSGTNQYHGDVWELYSGSGLDSLNGQVRQGKPYPAGSQNPKARYDQHQPGFTLGGPIWKDKLFGFGGAQYSRFYGNASATPVQLPDAAGYAQLTAIGGPQVALLQSYLYNGSYLSSYSNLSLSTTQGYASRYKISARPGCAAGCFIETASFQRPPVPEQQPETQWLYRVDFIPRQKDVFSVRYLHDHILVNPDLSLNPSGLPGFDGEVSGPSEVGQGTWTHIATPHLLNELRASETRVNFLFTATPQTLANPLSSNYNITFSGAGFGGSASPLGVSQNIPQGRDEELYQFQDTVSWSHGRHAVRAGVDIGRQIEIDLVQQFVNGGLTFTAGGALSALDNFLDNFLGASGTASRTVGPTRIDPHSWRNAVFAQDDIKLAPEFTVNLGVRYDYATNPENSLPYPAVDPGNPFAPINTVVKIADDKNNVSPRIGFAWNPREGIFRDGKTVFHGGFAGFYDMDFTNIVDNNAESSPNAISNSITSTSGRGLANATTLIGTIAPVLSNTSSVTSVASNLINPLVWQWDLGIERQLPAQFKLGIHYLGNRGEKLFANQELNYFVNNVRLNAARGAINIRGNRGDSEYNSIQTNVSHQFSHGFFFLATYTFGKDLDDASEVFTTYASPSAYTANLAPNGIGQDWGPSVWDRRHYASFVYSWTPAGFHASGPADALLSAFTRHITISGTTQFQSGPYSTFNFSGLDSNGDGSAMNDRPILGNRSLALDTAGFDGAFFGPPFTPGVYYDYVTGNAVTPSQEHWLVPSGNQYLHQEIGRNSFENPGTQYWNLATEKAVPASWLHFDRGTFIFRVEAQNFTNHDNIGPLNINLLNIGTEAYLSRHDAVEAMNRHLLLWAKFKF